MENFMIMMTGRSRSTKTGSLRKSIPDCIKIYQYGYCMRHRRWRAGFLQTGKMVLNICTATAVWLQM